MKEQNCPKEDLRKALGGNHYASALGFKPKIFHYLLITANVFKPNWGPEEISLHKYKMKSRVKE